MKNTILLFGLAISISIVVFLWFCIWVNRGNESIIWLFAKTVVGPLVLASALLFYEFFSTHPPVREENISVVIPYTQNRKLVNLSAITFPSGDRSILDVSRAWKKEVASGSMAENLLNDVPFFLDAAEAGTLVWLQRHIGDHWDVDRSTFPGLYGGMGQMMYKKGAEKNPLKLRISEIASQLPENHCYTAYVRECQQSDSTEQSSRIVLPSSSVISFQRSPTERLITIENRHMLLWIAFTSLFGETDGPETIALKHIRETLNISPVCTQVMQLQIHYESKRFLRWSNATLKQEAWATDVIDRLKQDFDWEVIRKAIERDYERRQAKAD